METANTKNPKDIVFEFADMLSKALGTNEEPNIEKACVVLMHMTELGHKNPAFIRKVFSDKFMSEIADLVPKFQRGELGMFDLIPIGTRLKKVFEDA
ncbi:hypothetical protein [Flectobacillus rivi]|uniref:Uncharacterized protein n=1 Tax=Flectobacillus rivi TaxID=2984209 RepID=A0ABT6Z148_9BACT|nr:hypothetical protein [Flectobacillus rivi]MDI9874642.1 hypothetical protein [Flectobacillus rivi]